MKNYEVMDINLIEDLESIHSTNNTPTFIFRAVCTSEICNVDRAEVERSVGRFQEVCPNCGHYLFWDRKKVS